MKVAWINFTAAAALLVACWGGQAADGPAHDQGGIPAGLSGDAWVDIQRQIAAARFDAAPIPAEPEVIGAHNPQQDLLLHFDQDGARLASLRNRTETDASAPQLRLQTLALSRGTQRYAVTAVRPAADGPRVEYRHDGWTEWYVNRAEGVEHGYTLESRPLRGDGPLRIELAVSGYRASQAGEALRFTDAAGRSLHYGKLLVLDADGKTLPATLTATAEDCIEIAFEDSDAKYPVVVDPLLVNEEQFIPNPGGDFDGTNWNTGQAVALQGDTLVLGAPKAFGTGAVWVYARINGVWTPQARLTGDDTALDDRFGAAVALDGDTILVGAFLDEVGPTTNAGSAYVFVRSNGTWSQQIKIFDPLHENDAHFGRAVALSGDTALIGIPQNTVGQSDFQGSAYIFTRSGTNWSPQIKLTAGDGSANDFFGISVALDGNTALIGAYYDTVGANAFQGSAYVFVSGNSGWSQQAQLTAADGTANEVFGFSVALDQDTAVIGAPQDVVDGVGQGAAYVFTRNAQVWTQQAQLLAPDGASFDQFGYAVAVDGDTAVVGAPRDDVGNGRGSAQIFTRAGGIWSLEQKLSAGPINEFGAAVALDQQRALIGAPLDAVGSSSAQGTAYLYQRVGTTWSFLEQLGALDGAGGDGFGIAVALDGDTALVGVPGHTLNSNFQQGAAYVFVRQGEGWSLQQKLAVFDTGTTGDRFGFSVALDGDTALIGAYADDVGANANQGSAYVFVRSGGAWSRQAVLVASDGAAGDEFGRSVALDGDFAIVGAHLDDVDGRADQGSAYVFVRALTGTWSQSTRLVAADGAAGDQFGRAVALDGTRALIGAPFIDGPIGDIGAGYVFRRSRGVWFQEARLTASDGGGIGAFGRSLDLEGSTAVIGAPYFGAGAVYAFTLADTIWTQQQKIVAADGVDSDEFGFSVALQGDTVLIGASGADIGSESQQGAAYLFTRSAGTWSQRTRFSAADGAAGDQFGVAVALSDRALLIGAPFADVASGADAGSVHIFRIATDFGDAPAPYPTLMAAGGAHHYIDDAGPRLGQMIGAELDGQPDSAALGDTDEDAITDFGRLTVGRTAQIKVTLTAPMVSELDIWVDFNADGDWDDGGEHIWESSLQGTGNVVAFLEVPADAVPGPTFARVRISTEEGLGPTGFAGVGEVEDYRVVILVDSDGDGMDDAWETDNGLDPNNPNDAGEDADGDGLSNLDEFNAGTDPNDPDSDGDGIGDAIDAQPMVMSNACTGADASFENTMVLGGTVAQCAASGSVNVQPTVTVEPGGRIEVYTPQTRLQPGFTLPSGAELGIYADSAP